MKKIKFISILTAIILLTTTFSFAETTKKLTLENLAVRLLEESPEIRQIEITARLNEIQYDERAKDYLDLKDRTNKARETWAATKLSIENLGKAYQDLPADSPERSTMGINLQIMAHNHSVALNSYKVLVKQEVAMSKNMESLVLMGKQATKKKEQEIERQKYALQKEYLNIVYLSQQRDLMNTRLKNLEKDIEIEKIKKDMSLTTQYYLENLENQVKTLAFNLMHMDINIESAIEALKTKLGYSIEEEFDIKLEIVQMGTPRSPIGLSRLSNDFTSNNLDLQLLRNNVVVQKDILEKMTDVYEADELELEKAQLTYEEDILKLKKTERSYEAAVKNAYYSYLRANENHNLQLENKRLAEEKHKQAEAQFKAGLISQRQLENAKYDLDQFMLDFNKTLIDFMNIRTEVDLLTRGIM